MVRCSSVMTVLSLLTSLSANSSRFFSRFLVRSTRRVSSAVIRASRYLGQSSWKRASTAGGAGISVAAASLGLADVQSTQAAFDQRATRSNDFFVQAMIIAAEHHDATMRDDHRVCQGRVIHDTRGYA